MSERLEIVRDLIVALMMIGALFALVLWLRG